MMKKEYKFTIDLDLSDIYDIIKLCEWKMKFVNSDNEAATALYEKLLTQMHNKEQVVLGSKKHKSLEPEHPIFQKKEEPPQKENKIHKPKKWWFF